MLTLEEFIAKYTNQPQVGDTPQNRGQCVGLIEVWTDNLGLPHTWGNANDFLKDADTNSFDVIHNTPDNVPLSGDILVWGTQVGQFGHTAIFISGDINTFNSFDQNWPLGSPCHIQFHNYSGLIGWLHPKTAPISLPNPSTLTDATQYDFGADLGLLTLGTVRSKLLDSERAIKSLNDQLSNTLSANNIQVDLITTLRKQLADCQNTPTNLSPTQVRILTFLKGLGIG